MQNSRKEYVSYDDKLELGAHNFPNLPKVEETQDKHNSDVTEDYRQHCLDQIKQRSFTPSLESIKYLLLTKKMLMLQRDSTVFECLCACVCMCVHVSVGASVLVYVCVCV